MNTHTIHKIALSLILGGTLSVTLNSAIAAPPGLTLDIAQMPLSTGTAGVPPNIMLMIDNSGSMDETFTIPGVAITPGGMPSGTTNSCSNTVSGGTQSNPATVNMKVTGTSTGTPKFCVATTGRRGSPCGSTTTFSSPSSSSTKCFDNGTTANPIYYNVVNFDTGGSLPGGPFTGAQLNWYFKNGTFAPGSVIATAGGTPITRLKMAKEAGINLVNSQVPAAGENPTVRLGLSTFDEPHGGRLLIPMGDVTSDNVSANSQAKKIRDSIGTATMNSSGNGASYTGDITDEGYTPLAEALVDIGRYFTTGHTGNLTLHPGKSNETTGSIADIFTSGSVNGMQNVTNATVAPIQYYCQKSAVIFVTDGLPNKDREVSALLRNYTGECGTSAATAATSPYKCDSTPTGDESSDLPSGILSGTSGNCSSNKYNVACKNGTKKGRVYESYGSDYLDDVAQALYEMDLRPSWPSVTKPTGSKNNLKFYAIGISDPVLQANSEDLNCNNTLDTGEDTNGNGVLDVGSVLRDAALKGGGTFEFADDYNKLIEALDKMVADIKKGVGSFSAITANATQLGVDAALFQAKYDTTDWTGDFLALPLTPSEDTNGNGVLNTGEDTNNNGVLDRGGEVLDPIWNAGEKIPAWDKITNTSPRNIFTYNPGANPKGIAFKNLTASAICANLSAKQKTALNTTAGTTNCSNANDEGLWRLDYFRGDFSHEAINTVQQASCSTANSDIRNANTSAIFRNRARYYNQNTVVAPHVVDELRPPNPWLLGDIVDSDPAYVSNENYGYSKLASADGGGTTYTSFVSSKSSWRKMIYVGANDGFLHGFDARISATDPEAGKEIIAYMPNTVFDTNDNLGNFSSPNYQHQYFVDGSPRVSDAYWGNGSSAAWHTVLVGTTGAGGRGIFALDVSDPGSFSTSDVLWEINTTEGPNTSDITTDTTALRGFGNNLGYTLPQPSIGRMNNGKFAAIVANGYDSANKLGVLYILDIETGAIIKAFDTKTVSSGLSTPFAADIDSNGTIDAIFAGDLQGNMWKFDVSDSNVNNWKIAYGTSAAPAPLFTACSDASSVANCDASRQPITNKPQVGNVGSTQGGVGVMTYFGTGKYFEDSDNNIANPQINSYYGVWDQCPLVSSVTTGTHSCPATTGATTAGVQKSSLVQQSIIAELTPTVAVPLNVRVTSNSAIDYTTQKGWYMDFIDVNSTANPKPSVGERIVSASLLRGGRIIFVTLVPVPPTTTNTQSDACAPGSQSTSWLMELDAVSGARPSTSVLDINNSGTVNSADVVTVTIGGQAVDVPASAVKMTNGSTKTPAVMSNPGADEIKFTGSSEGTAPKGIAEKPPISSDKGAGRQSWRQL